MSEYEHNEHLLDEIQRLRESNFHLRKDCEEQKNRIKRLEEELEQTKQDRNAIAKNTREPLLLKLDHAAERIKRLEELLWLSQPVCEAKEAKL